MDSKDKFLYYSLGVGFFIVALVFFYDDYSSLFRGSNSNASTEATPVELPFDTIPSPSVEPAPTPPVQVDLTTASTYTVQEGDTPYSIAQAAGVTVEDLMSLNKGKIDRTGLKDRNGNAILFVDIGAELRLR